MAVEQAIRLIDEHLVWLASRRMINNAMLQRLSGALQEVVDYIGTTETKLHSELNEKNDHTDKIRNVLYMFGFSYNGVDSVLSMRRDFIERYAEISSDKGFPSFKTIEMFFMVYRNLNLLAQGDVHTVNGYKMWAGFNFKNNTKADEKRAELMDWHKKEYGYLVKWFEMIDRGGEPEEHEVFEEAYQYHLSHLE